jgi:hypothetical protein
MSSALPPPSSRRATALFWAIPALAVLLVTLLVAAPSLVKIATGMLMLVAVLGFVFTRWPAITIAMMPVLIIPPQFARVFAYEVLIFACAVGLALIGWRRRAQWVMRLDAIEIVLWLLVAWATFTFFWCRDTWWWMFGVRKIAMCGLSLWVALRMTRFVNPDLLLLGVPAGACALSIAILARVFMMGGVDVIARHHMRASSTDLGWGAANYIAALLSLMLPTGIHMAMTGRRKLYRIIGWASIPLTASVVTIAASRGGALLVVAVALFAVFRSRIKPWMAVLSATIMLSLLLTGPGAKLLLDRFTSVEDMSSVVVRLMYWRVAWVRVVDHWPLGMGLNQGYGYLDRLYTTDPHNYWFVLASELGALGLILWITFLVMLWKWISRIEKHPGSQTEGRAMQLTFGIAMLNLMFEPTFQGLQYSALFYWIMGVYLGRAKLHARTDAPVAGMDATPADRHAPEAFHA